MANTDEVKPFDELLNSLEIREDDPTSGDENEFAAVLANIDLQQLSSVASQVRRSTSPGTTDKLPSVGASFEGSYNILFPLDFEDGTRWLAKVPINGVPGKWDQPSADSMISEVNTMRLLKRETTIPLPEVFSFCSTTENDTKCPYILMSFISGKPLYDVWFGQHLGGVDMETLHARRMRALNDIGAAMAQLGKFTFEASGSPKFDEHGRPSGVGPVRCIDHTAMLERLKSDDDDSDDPLYVEAPTSEDPQDHYNFFLDLYPGKAPFAKGRTLVLKELIKWIPEPANDEPFVLTHPDFDIQNFIVSEDGQLRGIIDWDGVFCSPRSYGNEAYPSWLTRDWDPMMYGYQKSMDEGEEPDGCWEDSPETLKRYRIAYDEIMSKFRESDASMNLTRMSLVTENLFIAACDPLCRSGILHKIIDEISTVLELPERLDFTYLAEEFADGEIDYEVWATLKRGMEKLLQNAQ
ncbi:unnamed protein product [Clonostachys rosea]|uniref:Aminoglycoside phosphotransferase domain-containing protein n=1 Tax=Bionectria ochroleuca TaxID=29856 RepID=A0ABY6V1E3_BIOOC|nr:unnamed protein product [Clonostachys rosea]